MTSTPQCPITPEENAWLNKVAREICGQKVTRHVAYEALCNAFQRGRMGPDAALAPNHQHTYSFIDINTLASGSKYKLYRCDCGSEHREWIAAGGVPLR